MGTTVMRNPEPGGGCERSMSMSKTNLQMTRRVVVFDDGCMRGRAMLGIREGVT
jgi:adenine/guanine phosphoribosyltransferase-like PRPP-binding protein